ncbi:MAG: hypothetical protein K6T31_07545, partial [Alicyclobacillus sp.]|nr:hypothetical protein [Alicyclobacillus sp.]
GYQYFSLRNLKDGTMYVRAYHYVMPFQQFRGETVDFHTGLPSELPSLNGHLWVPVDDTHCVVYNWMLSPFPDRPIKEEEWIAQETFWGRGPDDVLPGYRLKRNRSNDYMIDRYEQKTKTATGIKGVNTQDFALQETMEYPFVDRSKERLGTSDAAIITMRQLLLEATRDVEQGKTPRGVNPETYRDVRPFDVMVPPGESWEIVRDLMKAVY